MQKSLLPREHYPALTHTAYLNQASLGMLGQPVVDAMQAFIEQVGRHGNLMMSDADEVAYFNNLRHQGALILGSDPAHIAILGGASEFLGQLPYLFQIEPNQEVLLISSDFPAITRPWLRLQQMGGCQVRFVDNDPQQDLTETVCSALNKKTAVVAVSYVQYGTGCKIDPIQLRDVTSGIGAKLVLDVTQAAGALPVSADLWGADAVVSSGYKWLGGHGGVALAAISDHLLQEAPPLPGWMGAPDPFDFDATALDLAPDAGRFTQSTMSYSALAGLTAGIKQLLKVGVEPVATHAAELAEHLSRGLDGSGWEPFRRLQDPSAAPHIISLAHPTRDVQHVVQQLRAAAIVCGARGGRIRVSLAAYNNRTDIDRLIQVLTK